MPRILENVKRMAFGQPIATDSAKPPVLRTRLAVPMFGVGVLSAVTYAPDAVVDALRQGGQQGAIPHMTVGVVLIMLLLGAAYRSNVRERSDTRADYGLVQDRLGPKAGIVTGAALLVDYLFTVAVSAAAMSHIVTYLFPDISGWERLIAVTLIAVMTLISLRGVRDRARVLVAVWAGFLVAIAITALMGVLRAPAETLAPVPAEVPTSWTVFLAYAGAVASGAVMMTGIEHLASSGPNHAEPRGKRAGRTVLIAVAVAAVAFMLVLWLAYTYRLSGWAEGPILLQVADQVFARSITVWLVAVMAGAILYAAASAVFRRFSGLASFLARDSYLPRQLSMRNDRLVYRGGVLLVSAASIILVVAVGANVIELIHMYVIGVFATIVLSQIAMVRHFSAKIAVEPKGRAHTKMQWSRLLHVVAALVAAAVWIVVAVFNFLAGAWIALALILWLVLLMVAIRRHYDRVRNDLAIRPRDRASALPSATHGLVLVAQLHRPALRALAYAKAARHSSLKAVGVQIERETAQRLQEEWGRSDLGVPLVILESPYRDIIGPVMDYVKSIHRESPRDVVVVYVPEYIVGTWWERFLHNRSTVRLRSLLLRLPGVVVSAVPWHLESARAEQATKKKEVA